MSTSILRTLNETLKQKVNRSEFTSTLFENGDGEFYIRGKNNRPVGRVVHVTTLTEQGNQRIKIESVSNSTGFLEDFTDGQISFTNVDQAATYIESNIKEE